jgi:hypothetical protein
MIRDSLSSLYFYGSSAHLSFTELLIAVLETPSISHQHAQQNAFRRRDARLQFRLCARWNQSRRHSPNSNRLCSGLLKSAA